MANNQQTLGFSYFSAPEFLIKNRIDTWFPLLKELGGKQLIIEASFNRAIPEDVFQTAYANDQEIIIHFTDELPLARKFNDVAVLLDTYAKWGVKYVILGSQPNCKSGWTNSGWRNDNLVDHFLDRFIPLADYLEKLGLTPVFPPLQPGGDYWDTAFLEMAIRGLKRRQMDALLDKLCLASFGHTFNRSLTWGEGGPENWPSTLPYATPEGQEDQIGFNNYEWLQAIVERTTGKRPTVLIMDAGNPAVDLSLAGADTSLERLQLIVEACHGAESDTETSLPALDGSILACTFDLDTLSMLLGGNLSVASLKSLFGVNDESASADKGKSTFNGKPITHYLLLPAHETGVSDVVLKKVRPIIKQCNPTIGFSLEEAKLAKKVSVFPDPVIFPDAKIAALRAAGCTVEILPQSGIEIATLLHSMSSRN
ncbi:MAG: hypothetical protein H0S79_25920 [Anaerolineaceae bacterium]|nr:hypothetical protein [Anaerolineaceae bacterium]